MYETLKEQFAGGVKAVVAAQTQKAETKRPEPSVVSTCLVIPEVSLSTWLCVIAVVGRGVDQHCLAL